MKQNNYLSLKDEESKIRHIFGQKINNNNKRKYFSLKHFFQEKKNNNYNGINIEDYPKTIQTTTNYTSKRSLNSIINNNNKAIHYKNKRCVDHDISRNNFRDLVFFINKDKKRSYKNYFSVENKKKENKNKYYQTLNNEKKNYKQKNYLLKEIIDDKYNLNNKKRIYSEKNNKKDMFI